MVNILAKQAQGRENEGRKRMDELIAKLLSRREVLYLRRLNFGLRYDMMMLELKGWRPGIRLIGRDSPTQNVGGRVLRRGGRAQYRWKA